MDLSWVDVVARSLPLLMQGACATLKIFAVASGMSLIIGSTMGILLCQRLRTRLLTPLLEGGTFVLRAVPFYVQLLIVYFVLPEILHLNLEAFTASVIALGLCSSGYLAQIVRCGIDSIPKEQWEAALTLGYSTSSSVRYIILPQMIRNILPALTNEFDSLLKSTAILSSIGLLELTRVGMNIVSREMEPLITYLSVAAFYVLISGAINLISRFLERRVRYAYS